MFSSGSQLSSPPNLLEALVDQGRAHRRGGRGDLVQQGGSGRVLVRRCRQDHHRDHQPQDVNGQAPLAAGHLLPRVPARGTRRDRCRGADALRVQHDQGRVGLPALLLPRVPAQQVMDGLVGAVVAPLRELVVGGAARRQVMRQVLPLAARPRLVQDRVDDLPHLVAALVAARRPVPRLPRREHRLDQRPPLIAYVTRVPLAVRHEAMQAHPSSA